MLRSPKKGNKSIIGRDLPQARDSRENGKPRSTAPDRKKNEMGGVFKFYTEEYRFERATSGSERSAAGPNFENEGSPSSSSRSRPIEESSIPEEDLSSEGVAVAHDQHAPSSLSGSVGSLDSAGIPEHDAPSEPEVGGFSATTLFYEEMPAAQKLLSRSELQKKTQRTQDASESFVQSQQGSTAPAPALKAPAVPKILVKEAANFAPKSSNSVSAPGRPGLLAAPKNTTSLGASLQSLPPKNKPSSKSPASAAYQALPKKTGTAAGNYEEPRSRSGSAPKAKTATSSSAKTTSASAASRKAGQPTTAGKGTTTTASAPASRSITAPPPPSIQGGGKGTSIKGKEATLLAVTQRDATTIQQTQVDLHPGLVELKVADEVGEVLDITEDTPKIINRDTGRTTEKILRSDGTIIEKEMKAGEVLNQAGQKVVIPIVDTMADITQQVGIGGKQIIKVADREKLGVGVNGSTVVAVDLGGTAHAAGIYPGDEITAVAGKPAAQVSGQLMSAPVPFEIEIQRKAVAITVFPEDKFSEVTFKSGGVVSASGSFSGLNPGDQIFSLGGRDDFPRMSTSERNAFVAGVMAKKQNSFVMYVVKTDEKPAHKNEFAKPMPMPQRDRSSTEGLSAPQRPAGIKMPRAEGEAQPLAKMKAEGDANYVRNVDGHWKAPSVVVMEGGLLKEADEGDAEMVKKLEAFRERQDQALRGKKPHGAVDPRTMDLRERPADEDEIFSLIDGKNPFANMIPEGVVKSTSYKFMGGGGRGSVDHDDQVSKNLFNVTLKKTPQRETPATPESSPMYSSPFGPGADHLHKKFFGEDRGELDDSAPEPDSPPRASTRASQRASQGPTQQRASQLGRPSQRASQRASQRGAGGDAGDVDLGAPADSDEPVGQDDVLAPADSDEPAAAGDVDPDEEVILGDPGSRADVLLNSERRSKFSSVKQPSIPLDDRPPSKKSGASNASGKKSGTMMDQELFPDMGMDGIQETEIVGAEGHDPSRVTSASRATQIKRTTQTGNVVTDEEEEDEEDEDEEGQPRFGDQGTAPEEIGADRRSKKSSMRMDAATAAAVQAAQEMADKSPTKKKAAKVMEHLGLSPISPSGGALGTGFYRTATPDEREEFRQNRQSVRDRIAGRNVANETPADILLDEVDFLGVDREEMEREHRDVLKEFEEMAMERMQEGAPEDRVEEYRASEALYMMVIEQAHMAKEVDQMLTMLKEGLQTEELTLEEAYSVVEQSLALVATRQFVRRHGKLLQEVHKLRMEYQGKPNIGEGHMFPTPGSHNRAWYRYASLAMIRLIEAIRLEYKLQSHQTILEKHMSHLKFVIEVELAGGEDPENELIGEDIAEARAAVWRLIDALRKGRADETDNKLKNNSLQLEQKLLGLDAILREKDPATSQQILLSLFIDIESTMRFGCVQYENEVLKVPGTTSRMSVLSQIEARDALTKERQAVMKTEMGEPTSLPLGTQIRRAANMPPRYIAPVKTELTFDPSRDGTADGTLMSQGQLAAYTEQYLKEELDESGKMKAEQWGRYQDAYEQRMMEASDHLSLDEVERLKQPCLPAGIDLVQLLAAASRYEMGLLEQRPVSEKTRNHEGFKAEMLALKRDVVISLTTRKPTVPEKLDRDKLARRFEDIAFTWALGADAHDRLAATGFPAEGKEFGGDEEEYDLHRFDPLGVYTATAEVDSLPLWEQPTVRKQQRTVEQLMQIYQTLDPHIRHTFPLRRELKKLMLADAYEDDDTDVSPPMKFIINNQPAGLPRFMWYASDKCGPNPNERPPWDTRVKMWLDDEGHKVFAHDEPPKSPMRKSQASTFTGAVSEVQDGAGGSDDEEDADGEENEGGAPASEREPTAKRSSVKRDSTASAKISETAAARASETRASAREPSVPREPTVAEKMPSEKQPTVVDTPAEEVKEDDGAASLTGSEKSGPPGGAGDSNTKRPSAVKRLPQVTNSGGYLPKGNWKKDATSWMNRRRASSDENAIVKPAGPVKTHAGHHFRQSEAHLMQQASAPAPGQAGRASAMQGPRGPSAVQQDGRGPSAMQQDGQRPSAMQGRPSAMQGRGPSAMQDAGRAPSAKKSVTINEDPMAGASSPEDGMPHIPVPSEVPSASGVAASALDNEAFANQFGDVTPLPQQELPPEDTNAPNLDDQKRPSGDVEIVVDGGEQAEGLPADGAAPTTGDGQSTAQESGAASGSPYPPGHDERSFAKKNQVRVHKQHRISHNLHEHPDPGSPRGGLPVHHISRKKHGDPKGIVGKKAATGDRNSAADRAAAGESERTSAPPKPQDPLEQQMESTFGAGMNLEGGAARNIVLMFGPRTSGKKIVAEKSRQRYGIPTIKFADVMQESNLDPDTAGDEVILEAMATRLKQGDCNNGVILDGYPASVEQAKRLDEALGDYGESITRVWDLEVSQESFEKRLCGRWFHPASGRTYHAVYKPPKSFKGTTVYEATPENMLDDKTGEPLIQREKDKLHTIQSELDKYRQAMAPVVEYYGQQLEYKGKQQVRKVDAKLIQKARMKAKVDAVTAVMSLQPTQRSDLS
ncbi:unnamed protein product [Amoebophrya sp. A120]|nr:unnamed protein product [Amoebophrya sp. A120]|eukprot:GSA120T00005175001.1